MELNQLQSVIDDLKERSVALRGYLDFDDQLDRLNQIKQDLEDPEVWNDQQRAESLGRERARLEAVLIPLEQVGTGIVDANDLLALALEEKDTATQQEIAADLQRMLEQVEKLEFQRMFSGRADAANAFLDIQSGAGGTEAQDWAEMLLRMYLRWCESNGFAAELIEASAGEVAGIKSATVHVKGEYAYGWLRTESGVHRLVRKSPFDSGNRRHTSFAAVYVSPEVDDDIEIQIDPADLRVDVYRASGAGGQHVNKTESAVRITHNPSGIVVQCQNDRSQHKNRATAMKQLKARLYEFEEQKRLEEVKAEEESKSDVGWGSQIRSYVLDQSRVKDERTGVQSGDPDSILNGSLNKFIEASLKQGL
ncbi:MAG: peptide chain release factor 2 [Chromatiales bacterium]|nr:peptide chain release factor 2 [Chromatiales bacterium]MDP6151672.1 peptide chain release factor 2 [Gammaproteobacteria bacterium]HJP03694.1 peptide chain release factor 2 [Gammaproteobacteria bacterium]